VNDPAQVTSAKSKESKTRLNEKPFALCLEWIRGREHSLTKEKNCLAHQTEKMKNFLKTWLAGGGGKAHTTEEEIRKTNSRYPGKERGVPRGR